MPDQACRDKLLADQQAYKNQRDMCLAKQSPDKEKCLANLEEFLARYTACKGDKTCELQVSKEKDEYLAELNRCEALPGIEKTNCLNRLDQFVAKYKACGDEQVCKNNLIRDRDEYLAEFNRCNTLTGELKTKCHNDLNEYLVAYEACNGDQSCQNKLRANRDMYLAEKNKCEAMTSPDKDSCLSDLEKFVAKVKACGNDQTCIDSLMRDRDEYLAERNRCDAIADTNEKKSCHDRLKSFLAKYEACNGDVECQNNLKRDRDEYLAEFNKCQAISIASEKTACMDRLNKFLASYEACNGDQACQDRLKSDRDQYLAEFAKCQALSSSEEKTKCQQRLDTFVGKLEACHGDEVCESKLRADLDQYISEENRCKSMTGADATKCKANLEKFITKYEDCAGNQVCIDQLMADKDQYQTELNKCYAKTGSDRDKCLTNLDKYVTSLEACGTNQLCRDRLESDKNLYLAEEARCNSLTPSEKTRCLSNLEEFTSKYEACNGNSECIAKLKSDAEAYQAELSKCEAQPDLQTKQNCLNNLNKFVDSYKACGDDQACKDALASDRDEYKAAYNSCEAKTDEVQRSECHKRLSQFISDYNACPTAACKMQMKEDAKRYQAAINDCESKVGESERNICIRQVNAYADGKKQCDAESTPLGKKRCLGELEYKVGSTICEQATSCGAGTTYNCQVGACISAKQDADYKGLFMDCHMQPNEEQKLMCLDNLKQTAETGKTLENDLNSAGKNLESMIKKGAMTMGAVAVAQTGALIAQMLGIGGKPCISGGILAVGSAIALMNEMKVNKELAARLKGIQEEFKAKTEGMDRSSLEYQKIAFDYALKGYRELENAYKTKARNYGMVQAISGAALAMAIIELIPMPKPMCPAAKMTAAAAGIMLGISSSLKSTATSAAKEMNNRGNILQEIINQFNRFHKDVQGLDDQHGLAGGAASGPDQQGINTQGINGSNRNYNTAASESSKSGGTSNSSAPLDDSKTCIGGNGVPDELCSCRSSNTCMSFNVPSFESMPMVRGNNNLKNQLSAVEKNTQLKSMSKNFNDLANGKISLARFVSLEERHNKNRVLYANRLVERFNLAAPKMGLEPLVFNKAMIKQEKIDQAKLAMARSVIADNRQIEGKLMQNQDKVIKDVAKRVTGKNWRESIKFKKKKLLSPDEQKLMEDFTFDDNGDDSAIAKDLAYNADELMGQASRRKKAKGPRKEINDSQDASIWSILSDRYQSLQDRLIDDRK
ncbi:MAG: hypothetical protein Fur0010_14360 [Bdellovibrio sp.]